uniref:Uncharacterized protein n=1 Tax=Meloidogyne enterolobii TaxID=390850 RepID=A0A6V7X015_MELEN|nr:unnamed protein product [Meloidogyne enterolobii]
MNPVLNKGKYIKIFNCEISLALSQLSQMNETFVEIFLANFEYCDDQKDSLHECILHSL